MLALAFFVIIGSRTAAKRRGRAAGGDGARVHGLSLERTGAEGQRRRKSCPILMPMPMDEVYAFLPVVVWKRGRSPMRPVMARGPKQTPVSRLRPKGLSLTLRSMGSPMSAGVKRYLPRVRMSAEMPMAICDAMFSGAICHDSMSGMRTPP